MRRVGSRSGDTDTARSLPGLVKPTYQNVQQGRIERVGEIPFGREEFARFVIREISPLELMATPLKLLIVRQDHLFNTHSWWAILVAIADDFYLVDRLEQSLDPSAIR
jgi:hypothetical protein